MSVSIRSCPGCDSLILADTFQCPDCGHVFDEEKTNKLAGSEGLATAEMEEPCPDCGHSVRAGLVRCPDCGRFMRDDIAKKYDDLQSTPQKIIYSDNVTREDYLPPRTSGNVPENLIMDAGDDDGGFELGDGTATIPDSSDAEDGFQLGTGAGNMPAGPAPTAPPAAGPDAATEAALTVDDPREKSGDDSTPAGDSKTDDAAAAGDEKSDEKTAAADSTPAAPAKPDMDVDGLLNIAKQDERESSRRKSQRRRKNKANRVLIPCSCGAWMRVREHQMGKTVRCRKCSRMLPVPQLLKKKTEGEPEKVDVNLPWMMDVDYVTVDPGNLRLKAGSVAGNAAPVDVILSQDGIAICTLLGKSKAGLFGSKGKAAGGADEKRESIKAFLAGAGSISGAPSEKTVFVPADKISELLVAQPVKHAHESMFAGVPVFGEGRIAVRVPAAGKGTEQEFLSMGLTDFRFFASQLERLFDVADFGKDQGVPQEDKRSASKCHYTGMILNALTDTEYLEVDRHVEMTLLGRTCGACGISVSEETRKKQKIGGASGRGLSRAKCPKCNGKFGNNSLYTFELKDTAPKLEVADASEDDGAGDEGSPA